LLDAGFNRLPPFTQRVFLYFLRVPAVFLNMFPIATTILFVRAAFTPNTTRMKCPRLSVHNATAIAVEQPC
jgi:hypothetical protein